MTAQPDGAAQAREAQAGELQAGEAQGGEAQGGEAQRARRRRIAEAKQSLRELRIELAILNHRVGSRSEVKDVDLDCLDVITRHGPISPSALARRIGVHLATMTGILDRLERGGWIVRARDSRDRRAVTVHGVPGKQRDIIRLYDGMNSLLDEILENYTDDQIDLIVGFLRRCAEAGQSAAGQLATDPE
jgi:DNA-binding MarR family transcriptional regulator